MLAGAAPRSRPSMAAQQREQKQERLHYQLGSEPHTSREHTCRVAA